MRLRGALGAITLAALVVSPAAGWAQGVPPSQDIAGKIEKSFSAIRFMSARFTQKTENKGFGAARTASGRMALKKPSRMRWEYAEPSPIHIVADGKWLWYFDQGENTVYKEPLGPALGPQSPAMFLAGEAPLSDVFDVTPSTAAGAGEAAVKLVPKSPQQGLKAILLKVDAKTYTIKELMMVDHLGNRNTIGFSEVETGSEPDDAMFTFIPPAGAALSRTPKIPGF